MSVLKLVLGLGVLFGGFVALMYVAQRSLMYHPERQRTSPAAAGFPAAREATLDTADGEKVIVWSMPPKSGRPLIIYFHGNAGSLRHRVDRFRALTADGTGLVALSYRGYGGSTGSPSEQGLIADAKASYRFALTQVPPERIVVMGESLGTGVAVALAASEKIGGLILQAPFTSAADVGASVYWYLPVRLLMKDTFASDRRIAKVKAPLLILHGAGDVVVPIAQGQSLFALANEPKKFMQFPEGNHVDLDQYGAIAAVRSFINEVSP